MRWAVCFYCLVLSHLACGALQFLGQQPFQAYLSRAASGGQVVYRFYVFGNSTHADITSSTSNLFIVNNGELILVGQISSNQPDQHNLTVTAHTDSETMSAHITINLIPATDIEPRFEHEVYDFAVAEDFTVGTIFTVIRAFSLDQTTNIQMFIIVSGNTGLDFSIGSVSGLVGVASVLDRERTDSYNLTMRYIEDSASIDALVRIVLLDANDNAPLFSETIYIVEIAESISIGSSVLTVQATDLDIGDNAAVQYFISADTNAVFSVDQLTGEIVTASALDFEQREQYQFSVRAEDSGFPPASSTVVVVVNLVNIDDECPRFVNSVFIGEVPYSIDGGELPVLGMVLLTVQASDPDRLGSVTYSIVSSNAGGTLALDSTTGEISLAQLNDDPRGQYTLNVSASDASCFNMSFARVDIGIGNVNNNSPQFETACVASLLENPPPGTAFVTLTATDEDIGSNGLVTYNLLTSTNLFSIDANGVVRTTGVATAYDRESQSLFQVGVTATDGGNRQDYCLLEVTLLDANDNAPMFPLPSYTTSLSTSTQPGTFVLQLQADDPDLGENGTVTYSLDFNGSAMPFTIHPQLGIITTNDLLSQNEHASVFVTIVASDNGLNPLTSSVVFTVTLVNGNSFPVFEQQFYSTSVCENANFGTPVTLVMANSNQSEPTLYETIPGSDYRSNQDGIFEIGRNDNGSATIFVSSVGNPDYELLAPTYFFLVTVQARNSVGSSLVTVQVNVTDIDDNRPQLDSEISSTLPENSPIGTLLVQLQGYDPDSGTNAEIEYRTLSPSPYFNISDAGYITSTQTFDFEQLDQPDQDQSGTITVEAYNPNPVDEISECPSLRRQSSQIIVRWRILDENDNAPAFPLSAVSVTVPEDLALRSQVVNLNATDPDVADLGQLIYSITVGNDAGTFEIDSDFIVLSSRLDFESTSNYTLLVEVSDGMQSAHITINIKVTDVDDEPPSFSASSYTATVAENAAVGTSVLTLNFSDPDSAVVTFSLTGLAIGRFAISPDGVISVAGIIDREEFPSGEIVFLVFAEGGSLATADVIVTVTDVNDYVPRFPELFVGRVHENTAPPSAGVAVVQVQAIDLDEGVNGQVSYALTLNDDDGFQIHPDTGEITAHRVFDREMQHTYTLSVVASDAGFPSLSATTQVLVEIGDDNDNAPFFPFPYMFARIFENSLLGSSVLDVPALDPDNGSNASITYSLVSSNPTEAKFELNPITGEVTLAGSLDYEIPLHRVYNLTIALRDPLHDSSSTGQLEIKLLDRNDNAPIISEPEYALGSSQVAETFPPGDLLAHLQAMDADFGANGELVYSITGGNEDMTFNISVEDGIAVIRSTKPFDHETTSSYVLTVTVCDGGYPSLSSAVNIEFNIMDINDEVPIFSESVYHVSVTENAGTLASVAEVSATDQDSGSNGEIAEYYIESGNEGGWFILNNESGVLGTAVSFDREERASYTLHIGAVDAGQVPMSGRATIEITVADVNDSPSSEGGLLEVLILAAGGSVVQGEIGPLYFKDPDIDDEFTACVVTFQSSQLFAVDAESCTLQLMVDNPPEGVYQLRALGRDGLHTSVAGSANITVQYLLDIHTTSEDAVTISLNKSVEDYLDNFRLTFPSRIASALQASAVFVLNVQASTPGLVDVTFTARELGGTFLKTTSIIQRLFTERNNLASDNFTIVNLPTDVCASEPCSNEANCINMRTIGPTAFSASSRQFVLFAPLIQLDYVCVCVAGTSGAHCELNFDDCYSNPCPSGTVCVDGVQDYSCYTAEGTKLIDFTPSPCIGTNPCMNGGTCVVDVSGIVCQCPSDYYGERCEYSFFELALTCDSQPCLNGTLSPGRDSCTCVCAEGFSGDQCQDPEILQGGCLGNPCLNGSTCTDTTQGPVCSCSIGFTGPNCRWPLNSCELEPCRNHGVCEQGLYGSHRCSCATGFTGEDCSQVLSACDSNPCHNGGRCVDDENGLYSCQCTRFYYGTNCEFAIFPDDICNSSFCSLHSNCSHGRESFTCTCDDGFSGVDCSQEDVIATPCGANPCLHGGSCSAGNCSCSVGFTGANCEVNLDECVTVPCDNGGVCMDGINGYVCECPLQITGQSCDVYCPVGQTGEFCETSLLLCTQSSCFNGATCEEQQGSVICYCPPAFTGPLCATPNDCITARCVNSGVCIDLPLGGYECACGTVYQGNHCELTTVSFTGTPDQSSYLTLDPIPARGRILIEFEFAMILLDGLLLYSTQLQNGSSRDFIAVEIVDGLLSVWLSNGGQAAHSVFANVSDGLWHSISISMAGKEMQVLVDYCHQLSEELLPFAACASQVITQGSQSFLDLGLPLWVGGVPFTPSQPVAARGSSACLRNLYLNGVLMDLQTAVHTFNANPGCTQLECVPGVCGDGECVPLWEDYHCVCPPLTAGDSCASDTEPLLFDGEVFAQYSLLDGSLSTYDEQISLWLRTEVLDGLLLSLSNVATSDSLEIEVAGGEVAYTLNLGSKAQDITVAGVRVDDLNWHFLEATRSGLQLAITLDNASYSYTLAGAELTLDIDPDQFFAGGKPDNGGILKPYTGCLRDIRLNGLSLPTEGSNNLASVTFGGSTEISYSCSLGDCLPNPCGDGTCSEVDESFACLCPDGRQGNSCPEPLPQPQYTLAIVIACATAVLVLCVCFIICGILVNIKLKQRRSHTLLLAATKQGDVELYGPSQCLVISNDPGGGEQDITRTAWSSMEGLSEQDSPTPSVHSMTKEDLGRSELPRANSPTIHAFIEKQVEVATIDVRDLDSVREFDDEGSLNSDATSLSSICSTSSKYTLERLRIAGPEFQPFTDILEDILSQDTQQD